MSDGVTFKIGSGISTTAGSTRLSTFFKVPSLPSSDMTVVDLDAGATGYMRCKITSAGYIVWEWYISGAARSSGNLLAYATDQWHWVSMALGPTFSGLGDGGYYLFQGAAYQIQGSSAGFGVGEFPGPGATSVIARLGLGVSMSSSYLNFPNTAGYRLSKCSVKTAGGWLGYEGPPSSDVDPASYQDLYLCRDTLGAASTLTDSCSAAKHLTAGPNGLTICSDGPYA